MHQSLHGAQLGSLQGPPLGGLATEVAPEGALYVADAVDLHRLPLHDRLQTQNSLLTLLCTYTYEHIHMSHMYRT